MKVAFWEHVRSFAAILVTGSIAVGLFTTDARAQNPSGNVADLFRPTAAEVARLMAETARVDKVELSPDGSMVAYTISRASVDANQYTSELYLMELDGTGGSRGQPKRLARGIGELAGPRYVPKWSPDGKGLSYFESPQTETADSSQPETILRSPGALVRFDLATQRTTPIPFKGNVSYTATNQSGPRELKISRVGFGYKWSPSGRFIAFTSSLPAKSKPLGPRFGVVQTVDLTWKKSTAGLGLFVLDVVSGTLELVTSDRTLVRQFAWSPDERELVIVAPLPDKEDSLTDLSVINRATRAVRKLVAGPGLDICPSWSPDGKWIAFASEIPTAGIGSLLWPSIVAADSSSPVKRFGTGESDPAMTPIEPHWSADSQSFYYASGFRMANELIRVDTKRGRVERVFADDVYSDGNYSFSSNGRRLAFTRSSHANPYDLHIMDLPSGIPQNLTNLGSAFPLANSIRIDRVSWPSRDGKFTIHGLLLTPKDAWRADGKSTKMKLPTVAFNYGGPDMVQNSFDSDGQNGGLLPLAARGYAVLAANTRGRGGYGQKFEDGMRDLGYLRSGYEDMIAGVDSLIVWGISDPHRLGVYGHSYGANVTAYTITQTNRFKAAVVHEAISIDTFYNSITIPGTVVESRARRYGNLPDDPFGDEVQKRLINESVRFNTGRIKTPALLTFGTRYDTGERLFTSMVRLKVPVEFVVFDAGHALNRPAQIFDELTRVSNWFDYWLRDMPYPDEEREKEYNAWKAKRAGI